MMCRIAGLLPLLLTASLIMGCAASTTRKDQQTTPSAQVSALEDPAAASYWSYLRFRWVRNSDGEVQTFLDPLVADQVLAPVLERYAARIELWRFHRRWPKDEAGHQFSLLLYTDSPTAEAMAAAVRASPVLQDLERQGLLRELVLDTEFRPQRVSIAGTSDPVWSDDVQREWPVFIQGASRMWLALVKAQAAQHPKGPLLERYRTVEQGLTRLWFEQANHAFFHHLSGLFGYKPVRVIRRDVMTF